MKISNRKTTIFLLSLSSMGLVFIFNSPSSINNLPTASSHSSASSPLVSDRRMTGSNNSNYHSADPIDIEFYNTVYSFKKSNLNLNSREVVAGVIPHHLLAGDMIAEFFTPLENKKYDTIILIGPNHFLAGESKIITSSSSWQTPFGILVPDQKTIQKLIKTNQNIKIEEEIFEQEHSIRSEVAFIKKTFPNSLLIPLVLSPKVTPKDAKNLAELLHKFTLSKKALLLASVDFSHYKDSQTAQTNDQQSIKTLNNFLLDEVYTLDIDSPPSIYTLLKYSQLNNSTFTLLNNSNSALLSNNLDLESTTSYVTGYFIK